jgi:hypothetical protein
MLTKKQSNIPAPIKLRNIDKIIPSPNINGLRKALEQLAQDVTQLNGAARTIKVQSGFVQAGNGDLRWLADAGFTSNEPVRVISMDHILIIIPDHLNIEGK